MTNTVSGLTGSGFICTVDGRYMGEHTCTDSLSCLLDTIHAVSESRRLAFTTAHPNVTLARAYLAHLTGNAYQWVIDNYADGRTKIGGRLTI